MITAVVLIGTEPDVIPQAAQAIADVPGVHEVYSVAGDVDLIAVVKVRHHEELAGVIADKVSKVPGVVNTQTYIAFQAFSAGDLAQAYSLGLDD